MLRNLYNGGKVFLRKDSPRFIALNENSRPGSWCRSAKRERSNRSACLCFTEDVSVVMSFTGIRSNTFTVSFSLVSALRGRPIFRKRKVIRIETTNLELRIDTIRTRPRIRVITAHVVSAGRCCSPGSGFYRVGKHLDRAAVAPVNAYRPISRRASERRPRNRLDTESPFQS